MRSKVRARQTIDTSVLVPALLPWHPMFERARAGSTHVSVVPAHVLLECFSVLTRLPGGRHLSPASAAETIAAMDLEPLDLPGAEQRDVIGALARSGLGGGAVYDGLIAATARAHDLRLVSLDRRAAATYEAMGVEFQML